MAFSVASALLSHSLLCAAPTRSQVELSEVPHIEADYRLADVHVVVEQHKVGHSNGSAALHHAWSKD